MAEPARSSKVGAFLAELKRRHVYQVTVVYAAVSFVIWQICAIAFPALELPDWTVTLVVVLTIAGLPVAVVLAWAYERTPSGIVRDTSEEPSTEPLAAGATRATVEASEDRRSIVVLPFDNMSPDPNDAYFSDGLTEEIISQLSHLRSLRVISRSSAMVFKNTDKDIRTIGRELNVEYVVEGSVRRAGDDLRITAQLIDAGADEHLWAETYARELKDVFEIQSDIALSVAESLQASLDPGSVARINSPPTESLDAHDAYLLARHHIQATTEEGMHKARAYLERALELDPGYAEAHLGLAWWYFWAGGVAFSLVPVAVAMPMVRSELETAISLDPDLGEAHGWLAILEQAYYWDLQKGFEAAQTSVQKDPNSFQAWMSYAYLLLGLGRNEECLEAVKRFVELEPLAMLSLLNAGWLSGCAGRLDTALEYMKRAVEADSGFFATVFLAWVYQARGEDDRAWAELLRIQDRWEAIRGSKGSLYLAYAFAREGRLEAFAEEVADLKRRIQEGTASWSEVALAYLGLREYEEALDCIDRAASERPPGSNVTATLAFEPLFNPIRDHPRFQAVLKQTGLSPETSA